MSLLLDALKKSGEAAEKSTGLADIQLEDAHVSPARQDRAQTETPHSTHTQTHSPAPQPSGAGKASATRAAGENLFAAKKAPVKKRQRLGIVPIALIAGGLFAAGGSIYVYLEITPPNQRPFYHAPTPPAPPAPAPITQPQPIAAAAPALVPLEPPAPETPPAVAAIEQAPVAVAQVNKPVAKKTLPHRAKTAKAKPLDIQHKQEPDSIDPILASAYQSYQSGDYASAWQRYREALSKDPKNRDALLGLAVIAQQQGQDDTALHYYRQVLALDPRDPVAHAGLSTFGTADAASKESRLKQLIAQQPDSAALHFALGNQYVEQSRWSDAQQAYFNALALEPTNALFAFNLATSLDHLGQRKAAARYYQQAVQFDTSGNSGFNRAQAQQRLNELTAAGR